MPVARWQGFGGATNPQGPGLRGLYLGGRHRRPDHQARRVRDLARLAQPPDHRRQAVDRDRSHLQRPLRAQHRDRLEPARDRHVRPDHARRTRSATPAPRSGSPSSSGCGPRTTRSTTTGRFYRIAEGLPAAEADPAALSGDHERGRVRARPPLRRQALRSRLHGHPHRRPRRMSGARAGLPQLAREEYGREMRVWTLVNIVQGETEKEARDFYDDYVHQKGDWEAARNMIDTFMLEINARNVPPERIKPLQEAFIQGWGGLPADRHQGADRRRAARLVAQRPRRRAARLAALRAGHARVPRRDLSAGQAGGPARRDPRVSDAKLYAITPAAGAPGRPPRDAGGACRPAARPTCAAPPARSRPRAPAPCR